MAAVITTTIPFTREGYDVLKEELRHLRSEDRPRIIEAIASAREMGDLSENAEYHAARERQGFIEARIADLEDKLSRAEIIAHSLTGGGAVKFGAFVTVQDEETGESRTLRIVGDLEADIKVNKISLSSPIAKALIGKKVDDLVEVQVPKGTLSYLVKAVEYR